MAKIKTLAAREELMTPQKATLAGFDDEAAASKGISLLDLEPLTTLLVGTRNSVYRIIVLGGSAVLIQGGRSFPDVTAGDLSGSSFDGSMPKFGWIGVGVRMQIWCDGQRIVTSPVRGFTTESNPGMHRPQ